MKNFTIKWKELSRKMKMQGGILMALISASLSIQAEQVTLLLVRHGETDWNAENRAQGQTDVPLNEAGIMQAKAIAEQFVREHPDLRMVYTSDLQRAYHSGLETANALQIPIETSVALREIKHGVAEGMIIPEREARYKQQREEIRRLYPDKRDRWKHTPVIGAETEAEVMVRMKNELINIAQKHPNQKVAVFSHGRAIRCFVADIRDSEVEDLKLPNCGMVIVTYDTETKLFSVTI